MLDVLLLESHANTVNPFLLSGVDEVYISDRVLLHACALHRQSRIEGAE